MDELKITSIGSMCHETYPCKHYVTFEDGTENLMSMPAIVKLCNEQNQQIPQHLEHEYQIWLEGQNRSK